MWFFLFVSPRPCDTPSRTGIPALWIERGDSLHGIGGGGGKERREYDEIRRRNGRQCVISGFPIYRKGGSLPGHGQLNSSNLAIIISVAF